MSDNPETSTEVVLPEAVRRAAQRANELIAAQHGEPQETPTQPAAPSPSEPPASPDTPPPTPSAEPAAPPPSPPSGGGEWEQRYRTLQGKYDSEIGALRAQVSNLERLLSTVQAPPPAPPAPAPAPAAPLEFSQEDKDLYGEDLLEAMARTAEAKYQPHIARLEAKIAQLEGGQHSLADQRLQDQVFDALDHDPELTGRWRQINTSQSFINWLQQMDEFSGVSRHVMLQHAYSSGDAMRTSRFFKRYMAEHTVPPPPPSPHTGAAPAANGHYAGSNGHAAPAGSPRLEDFAAPGRAAGNGAGGGNGAPNPRIWTRPEITQFYRDRTEGRYKGREDESNRLEADLIAASREGRIR